MGAGEEEQEIQEENEEEEEKGGGEGSEEGVWEQKRSVRERGAATHSCSKSFLCVYQFHQTVERRQNGGGREM